MARPKEAILSKNLIRDQALSIIDQEGLGALTMRRLAERLGVKAASLYTHFANKDAVLDAIANRLATSIDPDGFEDSWQTGLTTWATSYYDVIHWHPNAAPIVAAGANERVDYLAMADRVHGGLLRHGWPARYATMVAASTKYMVLGAATTNFGAGFADSATVYTDLPNLRQAHLISQVADTIDRDSFMLGLESLIRGLEAVHQTVVVQAS